MGLNLISHFEPFQLIQPHYKGAGEKTLSWWESVAGGGQGSKPGRR